MVVDKVYELLNKISLELPSKGTTHKVYMSLHTARMIKLHAPSVISPELRKEKLPEGRLGQLWDFEILSKDLPPWSYEITSL